MNAQTGPPTVRFATPVDLKRIEAETGRDYTGPCTLIVERDGRQVGLLAVRDRTDLIEVCRLEAETPQICLRLVQFFEQLLASLGIDRYRSTADPGHWQRIAAKLEDRGVLREIGRQGFHIFYERVLSNAEGTRFMCQEGQAEEEGKERVGGLQGLTRHE